VPLILRIVRVGLTATLAVGLIGWGLGRARFGPSDQAALSRVETELRQRFDASAATLGTITTRVAADPETPRIAPRDQAAVKGRFDLVAAAMPGDTDEAGRTGVTLYDALGVPLAWAAASRISQRARAGARDALHRAQRAWSAAHPHRTGGARWRPRRNRGRRTVAGHARGRSRLTEEAFLLPTTLVPVTVRARAAGATSPGRPFTFVIAASDGGFVLEAEVSPDDLAAARTYWRNMTWAVALCVVAMTLMLLTGPLIDLRRQSREMSRFLGITALMVVLIVAVRA